jgi:uncharacterized repeat protein (TIGR02543 family)
MCAVQGQWTFTIENGGATITASTATGAVTIPSAFGGYSVLKVGSGSSPVFGSSNTTVTSVVIPNSVTTLAQEAFKNCTSLTNVTLGNGVTIIGVYAFAACFSLTSITIPNSVTDIGESAFNSCTSLTSATLGSGLTSIGTAAFRWCGSLISITIPNSVTSIGAVAFEGCSGLTNATIGTGLTSIGDGAFNLCWGLPSISVDSNNPNYSSENGILFNKLKTILIKCPTAKSGSYTIPNSVTTIRNDAFIYCQLLTAVTIPDSVTSIGDSAFHNCISLSSITIGSGVTSIGNSAFNYCTSLTSITIPNSVTSIGASAFNACTSLTSITIPSSVTNIGVYAFISCTSLTNITIGSGVTRIGDYVFYNCISLSSITIGSGVTSIGDNAFTDCGALARVEFLGNAPSYVSTSFRNAFPVFYYVTGKTGWGSSYAGLSTAVLGSYLLTTVCSDAQGTVLVNPSKSAYQSTDSVTISVTPKSGYLFNAWSGASTATTSSITFTMNSNKTVTANFIQDGRDADGDGLTNYQESITYGTNPNQKDTNSDGVEDGRAVALGYSPTFNFGALTSYWQGTPPTGLYTASQMQAMAIGDLVLTKNANGSFTLNYDIEQSTDLQTWTPYQALSLPLTGLPTDKAFLRIKARQ